MSNSNFIDSCESVTLGSGKPASPDGSEALSPQAHARTIEKIDAAIAKPFADALVAPPPLRELVIPAKRELASSGSATLSTEYLFVAVGLIGLLAS